MNLTSQKHQYGFTLAELMVAVTIGLIVLAGASSVMVSNKKTYTAQDSLARMQENARAAMLMLTYDIRNIGYWGCNPDM
ncbi:MAG: PilW family protein, partial [Acidiferrobacterales bacterium]